MVHSWVITKLGPRQGTKTMAGNPRVREHAHIVNRQHPFDPPHPVALPIPNSGTLFPGNAMQIIAVATTIPVDNGKWL